MRWFSQSSLSLSRIFQSQRLVRWSQINSSLQMLWYFLYQAFQVNNLNFLKSWRRITDFMAINVTWEILLSHSSIFMKVQTGTFPRGSKSTLEIPWDNFSEAQDKGQGHGQSSLHVQGQVFCQGRYAGSGVSRPWWKSGSWSSPALSPDKSHDASALGFLQKPRF